MLRVKICLRSGYTIVMDKRRMVFKKFFLEEKGQSTVEYILLMAVIVLAINTVFRSATFQRLFGQDGALNKTFRGEAEYSYRHALRGRKSFREPNYRTKHDSYIWQGSKTRFFGAKEKYPKK